MNAWVLVENKVAVCQKPIDYAYFLTNNNLYAETES